MNVLTAQPPHPIGEGRTFCPGCFMPHLAINGMTPWDYYHEVANLGKYEDDSNCSFDCACKWLHEVPA